MTEELRTMFVFLLPWEFSPAMLALCAGAVLLYVRGLIRAPHGVHEPFARKVAFIGGWALIYFVTQTHYDYLSQHMFFIHRVQHLVLHHIGPFLIALSQPIAVLGRGLPRGLQQRFLIPLWSSRPMRIGYRILQNAFVAPVLFVGLIFFWLTPTIHFDAMLSARLYQVMNWSMLLDGLLFWALMLDPRSRAQGALLGFGTRILILIVTILPQIILGAYIALSGNDLYSVYAVCGRAWDLSPHADQVYGGLTTWIPPGMMNLLGVLILLARLMHADEKPVPRDRVAAKSTTAC
jgi:putative membrane protein